MGTESACAGQFWAWVGRVLGVGVGVFGGYFCGLEVGQVGLQGDVVGFGGRRVVLGHGGHV